MRINFVLPFAGLHGGIRVVAIYAARLKQRGHQVSVVSTPPDMPLRRKMKSLVLRREWPRPRRDPSHFDGMSVPHRVLETVRPVRDADVPDADVVIATYYTTALGVQQLSRAKGAKAIFIQGYEVDEGRPNPQLDATWRMPMHKIAVSKWLVDLAERKFGDTVVSHVPNSVDLEQFHAAPRGKRTVPTVGFMYSNSRMKGCAIAVEVLNRVAAAVPSLRVVSFGADKPTFGCRLPHFVEFHHRPPQHTLKDIYAQCDLWLCTSILEGFSLPLLEAMACRCPVVSTRAGGPLDIVDEGVNGFLANVNDVSGLVDRVKHVINLSNEQWMRMSEAAHRTAIGYTWDHATGLFEQALQQAVERSDRGELAFAVR